MTNEPINIFEVKDKDVQVVYIGNVITLADWIFYNAAPKSALQVIIPKEYSNHNYYFEIVISGKNDIEKVRFKVTKFA